MRSIVIFNLATLVLVGCAEEGLSPDKEALSESIPEKDAVQPMPTNAAMRQQVLERCAEQFRQDRDSARQERCMDTVPFDGDLELPSPNR